MTDTGAYGAERAPGPLRAELANAMVRLWKEHYGRGPTAAKAYLNDAIIFVVLEDGLTRNEQTLVERGREEVVREFRLAFNEAMAGTSSAAVEDIVGRRVLAHHSQVVFAPPMTFEIFLLDGDPLAA